MLNHPKKAISFGAEEGVNSIAMTIMLFKRGEIYPVVFADVGNKGCEFT